MSATLLSSVSPLSALSEWLSSSLISKGVPNHPAEESNFDHLCLWTCLFGHDPKFMTICERGSVDRLLNREPMPPKENIRGPSTPPRDPKKGGSGTL